MLISNQDLRFLVVSEVKSNMCFGVVLANYSCVKLRHHRIQQNLKLVIGCIGFFICIFFCAFALLIKLNFILKINDLVRAILGFSLFA